MERRLAAILSANMAGYQDGVFTGVTDVVERIAGHAPRRAHALALRQTLLSVTRPDLFR